MAGFSFDEVEGVRIKFMNSSNVKRFTVSKQSVKLFNALIDEGVFAILEHCDGKKCVDIYIPEINLFVEVDGVQHYTDAEQLMTDLKRDHYSDDAGFDTFRVPNVMLEEHIDEVVEALKQIISRRRTLKAISKTQ